MIQAIGEKQCAAWPPGGRNWNGFTLLLLVIPCTARRVRGRHITYNRTPAKMADGVGVPPRSRFQGSNVQFCLP